MTIQQENGHVLQPFRKYMANKTKIEVEGGVTYGPYSPGVKIQDSVWLSGQVAPEAGDDVAAQTSATLDKIDALLAAAGVTKNEIYYAQVILSDIADFPTLNEVYSKWMQGIEIPPARATFQATLPANAKVEIVVQALGSSNQ